jgi:signal peptidase
MHPSFKTGDILLMKSTDIDDIGTGDIIMFKVPTEQELIIHRVESVNEEGIITKGDATNVTDSWIVEHDDVEAEVMIVGGSPIVLKGVGWYFIENAPTTAPFSGELRFTSLMLMSLKNIGIILFLVAFSLYLLLVLREIQTNPVSRRRRR